MFLPCRNPTVRPVRPCHLSLLSTTPNSIWTLRNPNLDLSRSFPPGSRRVSVLHWELYSALSHLWGIEILLTHCSDSIEKERARIREQRGLWLAFLQIQNLMGARGRGFGMSRTWQTTALIYSRHWNGKMFTAKNQDAFKETSQRPNKMRYLTMMSRC